MVRADAEKRHAPLRPVVQEHSALLGIRRKMDATPFDVTVPHRQVEKIFLRHFTKIYEHFLAFIYHSFPVILSASLTGNTNCNEIQFFNRKVCLIGLTLFAQRQSESLDEREPISESLRDE